MRIKSVSSQVGYVLEWEFVITEETSLLRFIATVPMIETPDLAIHYRTSGQGDQALVFVHGNYASSRWWVPQLERIPSCLHAYAPDLRGCGGREGQTRAHPATKTLSIRDLADDLEQFITALGLANPILVGHSLGGMIVTEYALAHPEDVRGMVLVDTAPPEGIPLASLAGTYTRLFTQGNHALMRSALRRIGLPRSGALAEMLVDDAVFTDSHQYMSFSDAVTSWDVSAALPHLNVPTLVVWGQRDQLVSPRVGTRYLHLMPNVKLIIMPGVGHSPPIERPDKFASILRAFTAPLIPQRGMSRQRLQRSFRTALDARVFDRFTHSNHGDKGTDTES